MPAVKLLVLGLLWASSAFSTCIPYLEEAAKDSSSVVYEVELAWRQHRRVLPVILASESALPSFDPLLYRIYGDTSGLYWTSVPSTTRRGGMGGLRRERSGSRADFLPFSMSKYPVFELLFPKDQEDDFSEIDLNQSISILFDPLVKIDGMVVWNEKGSSTNDLNFLSAIPFLPDHQFILRRKLASEVDDIEGSAYPTIETTLQDRP